MAVFLESSLGADNAVPAPELSGFPSAEASVSAAPSSQNKKLVGFWIFSITEDPDLGALKH